MTEISAQEGILLLGNGEEPNSLDPHIATTIAEAHILYALFEGLVTPDPDDPRKIAPGAASKWEYSPTEKRYTFTLRQEARWSDGSPVTAFDFERSVQRALDPGFGTAYPEMFFDIRNAKDYFQQKIDSFDAVGIKALSNQQLEIVLQAPSPNFLQKLKHFAWLPAPIKAIETRGDWKSRSTSWATPEGIVSNGPFALKKWVRNSLIEVERSSLYWDRDSVALSKIRFFPYENAQVEYRAFQSRQLHATDKAPIEILNPNEALAPNQKSDPFLATSYLIFNTSSPKLGDLRFREALGRAIDKTSLANDINRSGKPATSFTPLGIANYSAPATPKYHPEQARQLLQSVFPDHNDIPELSFVVSNNPASRAVAEAIQAMWSETLGLNVTLLNMEAKTLFSSLNTGDFEISFLSWTGDYEDPSSFLDIWSGGNTKNRAQWKSSEYDSLLAHASVSTEPEKRMKLLSEAESILLEQAPIIPLIWKTKDYFIDPSVANWPPAPLDIRSYKRVEFSTNP